MKKTSISATIGLLFIASASYAAPFMAVGSSAELFVTAKVAIEANDNLTLGSDYLATGQTEPNNPVLSDTVFKFAPGLSLRVRQERAAFGSFGLRRNHYSPQ